MTYTYAGSTFEAANDQRRTNTSIQALQRARAALKVLISQPPTLRTHRLIETLRWRLTYPSASYTQLASYAGLSKDAYARRFYRALEYAEQLGA
jgi:DNA-binding transcriptional regulator WhiA